MSEYKKLSGDALEEHFANYLIDSWSYSKVATFSRNEKAFEMENIYNQRGKLSATAISGQSYHDSLENYFCALKDGEELSLAYLTKCAFDFVDETPANKWKLQKTTPTIEECIKKCNNTCTSLVENFYAEKSIYIEDLKEILDVELKLNEWIKVNGVSIPLPCHVRIDLAIKTKDGKIVIIDHKSKASYTDEKEAKFVIGKQAITYALVYEAHTGNKVDEVWFIENKHSKNRDKSSQLKPIKIKLDKDTRRLYEALLYEPLKRMIQAVSDPDYVYMINDNDNFTDKAELFEFWMQTMIAEVDDFNVKENKKDLVAERLKKIRNSSLSQISPSVIKKFKNHASEFITYDLSNANMTTSEKIEYVYRTFGKLVKVEHEFQGVSSNTYLLSISAGVTVNSLYQHRLDVANALNVGNIRLSKELKVYDGKSFLAIEAAKKRETNLLFDEKYVNGNKIPMGIDNFKNVVEWDLDNPSTPHMLICGATGSGKSVSIISIIEYALLAGIDDIQIFDPKYEFLQYTARHKCVSVYNDIEEIETVMACLVDDMNERVKSGTSNKTLIIFDEFADAVANSRKGNELKVYEDKVVGTYSNGRAKSKRVHVSTLKSLEENLKILLQKGRSTGFRIIAATQRASTKVITGDAKVNFPVQVCFKVPKEVDSKVVIDESGAESLSGKGDGLFKSPEYMDLVRFQAFYKDK